MNEVTKLHHLDDAVFAWREQLAQASENPWLAELLLRYGQRILRRFIHFYEQLQALPRRLKRYIRRRLALSLGAAALLLALSPPLPAHAAAINVDAPGGVGVVAAANDGQCSLVEAIYNANNDTQMYSYAGECYAGLGPDTIYLPAASTFTLSSIDNNAYGATGLPVIASTITIEGNGSTIQRGGVSPPDFRILAVNMNGDLTLKDATVSGGRATDATTGGGQYGGGVLNVVGTTTLENSTLSGNYAYSRGGGLLNYNGTVTIDGSTISGNTGDTAGGVFNWGHGGGPVATVAILNNSTVSGNTALWGGGVGNYAAYSGTATLTVLNSTISGNTVLSSGGVWGGGGVINFAWADGAATTTIDRSTISENTSYYYGGGVANSDWYGSGTQADVTITNSTLSGNTATLLNGGGVGDRSFSGTVTITNSTLSGNTAYRGGGVSIYWGGTVTFNRSIVSGNTAGGASEVYNYYATVYTNNYNLFGHSGLTNAQAFYGFAPTVPSDITATSDGSLPTALANILNPVLANNSPSGLHDYPDTHALVAGSPAIDGAPSAACIPPPINGVDERGGARNVDGDATPSTNECDIGAYEYGSLTTPNAVTINSFSAGGADLARAGPAVPAALAALLLGAGALRFKLRRRKPSRRPA